MVMSVRCPQVQLLSCIYLCMSLMNIVQPVTISKAVAKISAMFPTVEESHIRDLYKKWVSLLHFLQSALS